MSFLDNNALKKILDTCIDPYDPKYVETASYELGVGNEYFTTGSGKKEVLKEDDLIEIKPGQFALLLTKETVTVPPHLLAFISIKASTKFKGLVNVSGFHVDPGFKGKLKFSVYNAGSKTIILSVGDRLFPIWFCKLTDVLVADQLYDGEHKNQKNITGDDVEKIQGEVFSPHALNEKIRKLDQKINKVKGTWQVVVTILGSLAVLAVAIFVNTMINGELSNTLRKEAEFKTNIETLNTNSNSQSNLIESLDSRIAEIEKKVNNNSK